MTTVADSAEPTAPTLPARLAVALGGVVQRFGELAVLDGIDLEVADEEVVALVGPSGCGKSTLLEIACALRTPTAGSVCARPAALMFQRDALLPWADATDNAALPLRVAGASRREARAQAAATLEQLGLGEFAGVRPHELSGGMRQRVAFARTLLTGRPVLCLDEPFGALDALTRARLQGWLAATLAERPRTVLLVTHDVEEAALLADRIVVLGPRPARTLGVIACPGSRPRSRTGEPVLATRAAVLALLGVPDAEAR